MRDLARLLDPSGETEKALDELRERIRDFDVANAQALSAVRLQS